MEAGKHNLKELFQKDLRYIIPEFQRPYVWNQERQWDPLWEDVRNLCEEICEISHDHGGDIAAAEAKVGSHFMGAIVLQQIPTSVSEVEQRAVIDGQQRMLTLQLLLDAAEDVIRKRGYAKEAVRLSKLVLNDPELTDGDEKFKLWPANVDREAFRIAMMNDGDTVGHTDVDQSSLVVQGHQYFGLQIDEWLSQESKHDEDQKVQALLTALMGLIELVVIDVKTGDDAFVIFETLNARGTPLLASDLIKNFVLQTADKQGNSKIDIYKEYWKSFEDKWWRKEIVQGRIKRPRVDVFLNYWLVLRKKDEVQSHDVFPLFKQHVKDNAKTIFEIGEDVQRYGTIYRNMSKVDPATRTGLFMHRWNTMQALVFTPVLMLLLEAKEQDLPTDRFHNCLQIIESFLVRRMICRLTTKDYNRLVFEILTVLSEDPGSADILLIEFLSSQEADSRFWPNDQYVLSEISTLPLYRLLSKGRLRLVLEGIENHLRSDKAETDIFVRSILQIEHILPQKWTEHWPLPAANEPDYMRQFEERERYKHTIGNLTLVSGKLNASVSNGPWSTKRVALNDHSVLFLNKHILQTTSPDLFAEKHILERSQELGKMICKIWPHSG